MASQSTRRMRRLFLFVAGVKGGLFSVRLDNVTNPTKGGEAGKTVGTQNYYSAIPEGSLLTSAAINPNGQFVIATSMKRLQAVYACFNPLGDPGEITKPINPRFFVPPANMVSCMQVGTNNMPANLTTTFGPELSALFRRAPRGHELRQPARRTVQVRMA